MHKCMFNMFIDVKRMIGIVIVCAYNYLAILSSYSLKIYEPGKQITNTKSGDKVYSYYM